MGIDNISDENTSLTKYEVIVSLWLDMFYDLKLHKEIKNSIS